MKKIRFRIFGITLVLVGALFFLNSLQITGLSILEDVGQTAGSFIGIILIVGGSLLFITTTKTANPALVRSLESIIDDLGEDTSIIIDSGSVIDLRDRKYLDNFMERLKAADKNDVYVPQEVLRELKRRRETEEDVERLHIESWSPHDKGIEKYRKMAQTYLDLTSKAQKYFKLSPFYQDVHRAILRNPGSNPEEIIAKAKEKHSNNSSDIDEEIKRVERKYQKQLRGLSVRERYDFVRKELENHFKPSSADRDVLAYALYRARMGNPRMREKAGTKGDREYSRVVSIFSNDSDMREAIDLIKRGYRGENPRQNPDGTHDKLNLKPSKKMWRYLSYISPREI